MWYTLPYATTLTCTPAHGGRAGHLGDRSPVLVRRERAPLPAAPRQCRGPVDHHACARPAWHRLHRPHCHAGVSPTRPRGAAPPLIATTPHGDHFRGWGLRVPAGSVAPESADVRHTHEPVDAGAGRRGQLRPGPDAAPGQRRHHASGPAPLARDLEAGHTWDHPSRCRVCPQQQRRAQLIQWAMAPPTWALGCGDAVCWRRRAPPDHHGWTDAEAPHKLQERTPPTDAPAPQALACDGLRLRPEPPPAEQMWRRFVTGRPVRAVTIAGLAWCSAPLAAQGFTALRWSWDHAAWHRRQAMRHWRRQPKQRVKRGAEGVRLIVCHWPSTRPWLNPMAPTWVPGKRAVSAPDRRLSAAELAARV